MDDLIMAGDLEDDEARAAALYTRVSDMRVSDMRGPSLAAYRKLAQGAIAKHTVVL